MATEILEGSELAAVKQLALFSQPPTQVSVKQTSNHEYKPIAPLDSNDIISFDITPSNHLIDLQNIWLKVTVAIVREDGEKLPKSVKQNVQDPKDATKQIQQDRDLRLATVNMPLWSLFKSLNVFIGTEQVCSMHNFNYLMYMKSMLNYDINGKQGVLQLAGLVQERPNANDFFTHNSLSFRHLQDQFAESRPVEMAGKLMGGIFDINRYICPFTHLKLDFHHSSDGFFLMDYENTNKSVAAKRKIINARLIVPKIEILDSISIALEKKNKNTVYRYPYTNSFIRTLYIGEGVSEAPFHQLLNNHIPLRVVIGLVDSKGYNGEKSKNPYVFQDFNVKTIYLQAGDAIVPSTGPYDEFDFDKGEYTMAYKRLCDYVCQDAYDSPSIDVNAFAKHACFHCFNLSPTSPVHRQLQKQGSTQVFIGFDRPLASGVQMIALIETQDQLDIDFARNVTQQQE